MDIGAGFEILIMELVELIVKVTGFEGEIVLDATKPNGQPRGMLAGLRGSSGSGRRRGLRRGLKRTVEWFSNGSI